MANTIGELKAARDKILEDQRKMLDKAEKEKRHLTTDEEEQYQKMEKDFDALDAEIREMRESEQRAMDRIKKLAEREDHRNREHESEREIRTEPQPQAKEQKRVNHRATDEYRKAFNKYLAYGIRGLRSEEERALAADNDLQGGFAVAPEQFVAQLIKKLDDLVLFRPYATVQSIGKAASLGAPALDSDPADSDWTAELKTGTEDSTMDFEKRSLVPHPCAKRIKVSNKLIRISAIPIEALVRDRLAYKFGITEEKAFLTGTGTNEPLGVFTASDAGITTTDDVSTGNTATSIKADGLIECKYALKAQYRRRARWIFHRDALKQIRKLKDGEGQYLWRAGISSDRPDMILDMPYGESEYAPNTFTTGLYVGICGDFSFYWIVDALDMTVSRLTELYAETNQTGFIGRKETDGMPVISEAFKRVKLG